MMCLENRLILNSDESWFIKPAMTADSIHHFGLFLNIAPRKLSEIILITDQVEVPIKNNDQRKYCNVNYLRRKLNVAYT